MNRPKYLCLRSFCYYFLCFFFHLITEACTTGHVLTLGQGDTGQLGLGGGILERVKPGHVDLEPNIKQAVAGGMHTVCLTDDGEVDFLS